MRPSLKSAIAFAAAAIAERPSSGIHAGVGRAAVEAHLHRVGVRRAEDDLADRSRLVVDVADPGVQLPLVEGRRSVQPDLLLRGEEELDPSVRTVLREHPANRLEHDRDRRLVVGAENRPRGVADDAVLEHRLDGTLRRAPCPDGHRRKSVSRSRRWAQPGCRGSRCPIRSAARRRPRRPRGLRHAGTPQPGRRPRAPHRVGWAKRRAP